MNGAAPVSRSPARTLAAYQGAHAGQAVVVCGCGPSLHELRDPARHITIGVNDVGRLFDPTYLVVVNPRSQFKADRFRHIEQSKAEALFTQLELGPVGPPVVRFKLGRYGGTDACGGNELHYTQNSPYVAVCLAAHLGATRIGLIGVDFTDHHFFAATGRHSLAGRLREIDAQYGRLAEALRRRGIELVNLGSSSRLTTLPRAASPDATPRPPIKESPAMKLAIDKRPDGAIGQLLDTLAATAIRLGHTVSRDPRLTAADPDRLAIVWNGRGHPPRGPVLYCEHGWLPRSDYQISPRGINAGSHAAPFAWDGQPLTAGQDAALDARLAAIESASFSGYHQYMQAGKAVAPGLPREFLLVPLQIESDTNIVHHAPAHLRGMQALIDHVTRLDPPWPVIFKQHPADLRRGNRQLALRVRRAGDMLWPQSRGNVHQMLKSGQCRGILTINSNVAHDGLLWDVPAIVLGRNIWPGSGERTPFLTAVPRDWSLLAESAASADGRACRRAYAHFLMQHQWTLQDAADPGKVAALLQSAAAEGAARRSRPLRGPRPAAGPVINVVAGNRGWLFEAWKQRLAATPQPGFSVQASALPLRQADAWIFVRAREAAASPDPSRTVVQLHDLLDAGRYRTGGERAAVLACAGLSFTHPGQPALLQAQGVDLSRRQCLLQPVGWWGSVAAVAAPDAIPTIAWIGRPARHDGTDVSRLDTFVEAARSLRGRARVVLVGERVEPAALRLRQAGVECRAHAMARHPFERSSEWIGGFDAVVISGAADAGPWPLFDAIHAGVPVVAARVGWAETLLADGLCGRLADDPESMAAALHEILAQRPAWHLRRAAMQERVAAFGIAGWATANLALAAALARPAARHAA